jgi:hypothetical protein
MGSSECGNEYLASIKGRVWLDQLDDYYDFKELVLALKDIHATL